MTTFFPRIHLTSLIALALLAGGASAPGLAQPHSTVMARVVSATPHWRQVPVQVCNPAAAAPTADGCDVQYQNQVAGYTVRYEWGGRRYRTQMAADPGQWIRVTAPVGNGSYAEPAYASAAPQQPVYAAPPPTVGTQVLAPAPQPVYGAYPYPVYQRPVVVYPQAAYPVYPAPVMVRPAPVYVGPPIGLSIGIGGGGRHGGWGVGLGLGF